MRSSPPTIVKGEEVSSSPVTEKVLPRVQERDDVEADTPRATKKVDEHAASLCTSYPVGKKKKGENSCTSKQDDALERRREGQDKEKTNNHDEDSPPRPTDIKYPILLSASSQDTKPLKEEKKNNDSAGAKSSSPNIPFPDFNDPRAAFTEEEWEIADQLALPLPDEPAHRRPIHPSAGGRASTLPRPIRPAQFSQNPERRVQSDTYRPPQEEVYYSRIDQLCDPAVQPTHPRDQEPIDPRTLGSLPAYIAEHEARMMQYHLQPRLPGAIHANQTVNQEWMAAGAAEMARMQREEYPLYDEHQRPVEFNLIPLSQVHLPEFLDAPHIALSLTAKILLGSYNPVTNFHFCNSFRGVLVADPALRRMLFITCDPSAGIMSLVMQPGTMPRVAFDVNGNIVMLDFLWPIPIKRTGFLVLPSPDPMMHRVQSQRQFLRMLVACFP